MSAAALAHIPLAAGGAVLSVTGNAIHWGIARFMRAPLANAGILAMVTLSAMAGSNALYLQRQEHPSPFFAPAGGAASREVESGPVIPATRSARKPVQTLAPLPAAGSADTVPSIEKPIGNEEVGEIQRKLTSMQIFDGAVDGLYGPRTARAIKTFEERMGMKPKGELTRGLLEAIRKAPVILPEPKVDPLPAPEALPQAKRQPATVVAPEPTAEPQPQAEVLPEPEPLAATAAPTSAVTSTPLPAPEPLQLAPTAATTTAAAETPRVLHRELPETPQEAMNIAVETAGDAIETIIAGVQTIAMTRPGRTATETEPRQFAADQAALTTASIDAAPAAAVAQPAPKAGAAMQLASAAEPKVGVTLALPEEQALVPNDVAELDTDATPEQLAPRFSPNDPVIVAKVQRALASLGFLRGTADGVAGEATSKAIRNFEVYFNYEVTGRVSPDLLDVLVERGATF